MAGVLAAAISGHPALDPHFHKILATDAKESPNSLARNRADQCVIPARPGGLPIGEGSDHDIRLADLCRLPRPGLIVHTHDPDHLTPAKPDRSRRPRHPTGRAISAFGRPSTASSTICAASPDPKTRSADAPGQRALQDHPRGPRRGSNRHPLLSRTPQHKQLPTHELTRHCRKYRNRLTLSACRYAKAKLRSPV